MRVQDAEARAFYEQELKLEIEKDLKMIEAVLDETAEESSTDLSE